MFLPPDGLFLLAFACGATSETRSNVDATPFLRAMGIENPKVSGTMTVELSLRGFTELTLSSRNFDMNVMEYSIDWDTAVTAGGVHDADCHTGHLPIEMTPLAQGVCE